MRNHTSVSQIVSLLAISLSLALSAVPAFAAEHIHSLIAKYVSWGVDEYELYGLTHRRPRTRVWPYSRRYR